MLTEESSELGVSVGPEAAADPGEPAAPAGSDGPDAPDVLGATPCGFVFVEATPALEAVVAPDAEPVGPGTLPEPEAPGAGEAAGPEELGDATLGAVGELDPPYDPWVPEATPCWLALTEPPPPPPGEPEELPEGDEPVMPPEFGAPDPPVEPEGPDEPEGLDEPGDTP